MREPLHLRTPLPRDNENGKLVEPQRDRRVPTQIVEQVEHALAENRAAQQQVVRPSDTDARHFHDLIAERALLIVELFDRQLRKTRFFTDGWRMNNRGRKPADPDSNGNGRNPRDLRLHRVSSCASMYVERRGRADVVMAGCSSS